jgi:hypothetical protein
MCSLLQKRKKPPFLEAEKRLAPEEKAFRSHDHPYPVLLNTNTHEFLHELQLVGDWLNKACQGELTGCKRIKRP